ncbi:hypothetical protein NQ318_010472 [Aromia moschata]|uniref:Inositol-pentakisphosphate 2-kinase n=1 Tax=Aromia moschata TaxID=1265417 RepID=A0AAV8Y9E5_9CUCU|nr:hypothetical protein NQ318_010472 [Aromia moschata]
MLCKENNSITNFEMPSEWSYRGEGNCNLVLSLPKTRQILRIRKIDRPKTLIQWLIVWISDIFYWYCGKGLKDELRDLKFYSAIMRPLIGIKYTSEANQVVLTRKQIKIVEKELSKHRPDFRKNKILQCGRAALFDDFAFLCEDEYEYLPFEMEKGQIKQISKYCPEDLFSGNALRMRNAIKSLIKNPQNNFRIFKNGVLCYGEKVDTDFDNIVPALFDVENEGTLRLQEEFCLLIQKCLVTNFININFTQTFEEKLFCEWNKIIQESSIDTILPKGCVLEKILSVQMLDTEGSYYYHKLLNKESLKDWEYVNLLLNRIKSNDTCLKCTIMMLASTNRIKDELDLAFVPYMISAIAQDCSLMITLKKIKDNISDDLELKNIIKTRFGHYLVNIGVFDLYPKPLSTIRKHYRRNKDMYQAYIRAKEKCTTGS